VPPYVSFLAAGQVEAPPYEPVHDMAALKELLAGRLDDLGLELGQRPMDLVLFRCAPAAMHVLAAGACL
jgi:dynein heavy chain